jgi:hypothetical protein
MPLRFSSSIVAGTPPISWSALRASSPIAIRS